MKVLVFDNYDSFTYNLVHMAEAILHHSVDVFRNDEISLEAIAQYDKIILSPGPGIPAEAGQLIPVIRQYAATKSILGVCLGHQAIAEAFGGSLINLQTVYHGIATQCNIIDPSSYIFNGLPASFEIGRYHSWIVNDKDLPAQLKTTAVDQNGFVMAMQHHQFDVTGVQFHPESVLTPLGKAMLQNWLLPAC